LAALAPGGLLGLVGLGEGQTTVDFLPIVARELTLRGSYCYTDDDFVRSIELLASRQIRADDLISVQPLSAGPAVFKTLIESPASGVKVLLQPD
jgi:threonine dehydrogenase-like Zn-dependent dehydrogenase